MDFHFVLKKTRDDKSNYIFESYNIQHIYSQQKVEVVALQQMVDVLGIWDLLGQSLILVHREIHGLLMKEVSNSKNF